MKWNPDFALHDFQARACRQARDGFTSANASGEGPFRRQLGIMGTGGGKTICAAAQIAWAGSRGRRSLFLAHTDELVAQAQDKIHQTTGEYPALEKAEERAPLDAPVVVGSYQSFASGDRMKRYPNDHFGLVVADEAHLSLAVTFQSTLDYFDSGGAWTLGITATPERSDRQALMSWYENVAFEIPMLELIEAGHLCPITVQTVPITIDATQVTKFTGDELEELEAAVTPYYTAILDAWEEFAADRSTLVFHPTRRSSRQFTQMAHCRRLKACHIEGESKDRKEILKHFHQGRIQMLNCAQLLVAGYDEPRISCIINLRPDRHRTPYTQKIGRGTRLCEGKDDLLILDFLWQFAEHGILRPVNLLTESDDVAVLAQKRADSGEPLDLQGINVEAERERSQQLIDRIAQNAGRRGNTVDARDFGALMNQPDLIDYEPRAKWERRGASEKQLTLLGKWKFDPGTVTSRGQASQLISQVLARRKRNLATPRQIAFLVRGKIDHDPATLTFKDASTLIADLIKQPA